MINGIFIFFHKSLKPIVYFAMRAYLNLDAKFSAETLDLSLDFINLQSEQ